VRVGQGKTNQGGAAWPVASAEMEPLTPKGSLETGGVDLPAVGEEVCTRFLPKPLEEKVKLFLQDRPATQPQWGNRPGGWVCYPPLWPLGATLSFWAKNIRDK
jgi:hypothetical protein